jgi:argininosuccinate lyase
MIMKLWGGRFAQEPDPDAWALNASITFDRRLALQDVKGSIAWAKALEEADVLTRTELEKMIQGLQAIADEFKRGAFTYLESDEDIHTAVERRLEEIIGPLAGKLHTGRSRNDQVATDFRLWLMESLPDLKNALHQLQKALLDRAETDLEIMLPAYTHLQRAQPILLGHWWLSFFWPLQRDQDRFTQLHQRTAVLPLGSGALAGTPYPVDRTALADELGFLEASPNSLDAVSDRDFAAEFLFCAALTGVHLSKLAEAVTLFSSAEFGFLELSDAYTTGSSLMPQKKNPDVFELARGKTGPLVGYLTALLTTLKGLPSVYDKDLQEDKVPVFRAFDTLMDLLPVLANAIRTLTVHAGNMRAAISDDLSATDLADYLVEKGIAFREAHELVGRVVAAAAEAGKELKDLSMGEFEAISHLFGPDVHSVLDPWRSVNRRTVIGATAPAAVRAQIQQARNKMK